MKKKLILTFVFVIMLLICTCVGAFANQLYYNDNYHQYDAEDIRLSVNGNIMNSMEMQPVIIEDRTMVPVRDVFEALGSEVLWHDDTCQVEIRDNGVSVLIKIGDRNTYVNGALVRIQDDQPLPMLIGNSPSLLKSMVPVRFIAEKLGYSVSWDNSTRTVYVDRKNDNDIIVGEPPIEEGYGNFSSISVSREGKYDCVYIRTRYGISPKVSRYSNPERVVFDFPEALFPDLGGSIDLGGNCVETVRYANHDGMARVVLDLNSSAQTLILSSSEGILLRSEKSANSKLVYDAYERRVYFDKEYSGTGKSIPNGYEVKFSGLSLENQKIEVHDGNIYEIIITKNTSGCTITVDGSNELYYTPQKGFVKGSISNDNNGNNVDGRKIVILDAGHGGSDPGAVGYDSNGTAKAYESHINLAITLLTKSKLEASGIEVILTRSSDKKVTLAERTEIENNSNCDMFVSIHCNSIDDAKIKGTQVYYHPASKEGTILANNIYSRMVSMTGLSPKKTQNGSHLYVIRKTAKPAVLVETAFISNESDRQYLLSSEGQNAIAEAISQGIIKTFNETNNNK